MVARRILAPLVGVRVPGPELKLMGFSFQEGESPLWVSPSQA